MWIAFLVPVAIMFLAVGLARIEARVLAPARRDEHGRSRRALYGHGGSVRKVRRLIERVAQRG